MGDESTSIVQSARIVEILFEKKKQPATAGAGGGLCHDESKPKAN
jgi:hypothetical protein